MSLQEALACVRSSPAPTNEESAKFKIIAPILGSLGWDMFGPQVLLEHSVGDKKAGGRVDIALKGSRGVVAPIEAKAPGADLTGHVSQVLGYAFHEGVDICVLTTGLVWWLYLPREKGPPEERRFAILNVIDDPLEDLADDLEAFLGNQALETGDAVPHANRVLQAQREKALLNEKIPSIWQRMIEEADEELVEVVSRRVYNEVNLRPDKEQVIAALRRQPAMAAPVPQQRPQRKSRPAKSSGAVTSPWSGDPTGHHPTKMVLFGRHYPIKSNIEGLVILAEVLFERNPEGFPKLLDVRGRTRVYVSRDPTQIFRPLQVGTSGYYLETNLSAALIWKNARLFLGRLGYRDSDLEVGYA